MRSLLMDQSATPLLIFMILTIITLALGVHAAFATEPTYGTNSAFASLSAGFSLR